MSAEPGRTGMTSVEERLTLALHEMTAELLEAAIHDRARLATLLRAAIAEGWEGFPEALPYLLEAVKAQTAPTAFGSYFFLIEEPRTLVGMGGFKGPPQDGDVEIGYAVAPAFQRRGLATAAVETMKRLAFADPTIAAVTAHTLAERNASTRVLEKTGFAQAGELVDPDGGGLVVWRWRCPRP